jgi:SDR family mycofactocin-dependent oxidoreductase
MGQLEGKVVFITGAARGQGRSHAVRFAEEGADVIAVDICKQIDSVIYPMSGPDDLAETVRLVEGLGRRIVAREADVRDEAALQDAVDAGVAEFGRLDFILANAGIMPCIGEESQRRSAWFDAIDVMLTGVFLTVETALPAMLAAGNGGAIVLTSSSAGIKIGQMPLELKSDGGWGYAAAKHGVVGLMHAYAAALGADNIRVNSVHPTGVATPMVVNQPFEEYFNAHPEFATQMANLLPVPMIEPVDISNAMVYLCSDAGRYVTGVTLPVDAGLTVR